jgi:O-antigen ligase
MSPALGSFTSALLLVGIIFYYFLEDKLRPIIPLVILGLCYFFISGVNYAEDFIEFTKDLLRFFIFILGVRTLASRTSKKELCIIFIIGALSILINAVFFSDSYGRYSGLYLNPNNAGFICIVGFALTYNLEKISLKLIAQFIFAICGLMTLSRTFILLLIIVNLIAIIIDKKNIITLVLAFLSLTLILSLSSIRLNTERFGALQSIFSNDVDTKTITKESRNETWAKYIDGILESPITGQGYKKLHGNPNGYKRDDSGVHNTFLMVIGEAGVVPFLIIVIFYLSLLFKSIKLIYYDPIYFVIATILLFTLMVSHNYFDNYILLFITIWLYNNLNESEADSLIFKPAK